MCRDQLRRILKIPALLPIEYKRHQDSLTDRSSYRNPTMVWRERGDNSASFGGNSHGHSGGGNREGGAGNYYNKGPQTGNAKPYGNSSYNNRSSYQGTGASAAGAGAGSGAGGGGGGARGQQDRDGSSAPYKSTRTFGDGASSERERDPHHQFHQGERDKGSGSGSGAHPYNRDRGATGAAVGAAAGGGSGGAWGKRTGGAGSEAGGAAGGAGGREHSSAWRSGAARAGAGDDAPPATKDKAEGKSEDVWVRVSKSKTPAD